MKINSMIIISNNSIHFPYAVSVAKFTVSLQGTALK